MKNETVVERLLRLAQEDIERQRRAFQDEMALARAKLAEERRELQREWSRVKLPVLETKPEATPNVVAESAPKPEVPSGPIALDDRGYTAMALAAIMREKFK